MELTKHTSIDICKNCGETIYGYSNKIWYHEVWLTCRGNYHGEEVAEPITEAGQQRLI